MGDRESRQEFGDLADGAIRQLHDAVERIDLLGISKSIGHALADAARVFGVGKGEEPSPYIIRERDVDKRVRGQYIHAGILFVVALVFAEAMLDGDGAVSVVICLALAVAHAWWGAKHVMKGRAEKRLAVVLALMADSLGATERISLVVLAELVEMPVQNLRPLLDKAIERGLIPEGQVGDISGVPSLYLTKAAWEADKALKEASEADGTADDAFRHSRETVSTAGENVVPEDVREITEVCASFARRMQELEGRIANPDVRASLMGISSKVGHLSAYVARHPDTAPQLRKLVTYYLPTTEKLALSYAELEGEAQGPETASTSSEIEDTLALVDSALDRLSDRLMQDQSWDLRSDMDVMRQMLDQDGLSDDEGGRKA